MTQLLLLSDIRDALVECVFLECILYAAGVSTFWKWWQSDFGWTIVFKTLAIAIVLLPSNLYLVFNIQVGKSLAWQWESVAGLAIVGIMIAWRFVVTWTIQKLDPPTTKSGRRAFRAARRLRKEQKDAEEVRS